MIRRSVMAASMLLDAVLWVIPLFFPWTPMDCQHQEIEITSGRCRAMNPVVGQWGCADKAAHRW